MPRFSLFLLSTIATAIAIAFPPLSAITLHIRYQNEPWIIAPGTTLTIDGNMSSISLNKATN